MHEMSIASSVLEGVRKESARRGGVRVVTVGLKVGELAGVDPESLRFCFETMVAGTDLAPLALDIEFCPGGDELQFSYLEIDEDDARAAGTESPQRE